MTSRVLVLDGSRPLTRAEVGGKAFSINDMRRLKLPVPPLRQGPAPAEDQTSADQTLYA